MRRTWLISIALSPVIALGVAASSHTSAARVDPVRESTAGTESTARAESTGGAIAAARAALDSYFSKQGGRGGEEFSAVHRIRPSAVVAGTSTTWGGYAANNSKGDIYTQVSATWQEPGIVPGSCPANQTQMVLFWVGLDGVSAPVTVEQDGSLAECFNGKPYYFTWWQTYPDAPTVIGNGLSVQPNDMIQASVQYNINTSNFTMTVNDTTTAGNNINVTQACPTMGACPRQTAEWVVEAPVGPRGSYPMPNFAPWNVTLATATSQNWTNQPIMVFPANQLTLGTPNPPGQPGVGYSLATPGALNGLGNGFTVTYNNSY